MISHILKLFGIPDGDGIFSPGGSMSMLYGVVAARYNAFPDVKRKGMWNHPKMILFTSKDVSSKSELIFIFAYRLRIATKVHM